MYNDGIKVFAEKVLDNAKALVDFVESQGLTNEQWFINWEDKLNELSIKDHSK